MICSTKATKKNPHRLLVNEDNSYWLTDKEEHKLSCEYCQKCLKVLSQEGIEDESLFKMKDEMFLRDFEL